MKVCKRLLALTVALLLALPLSTMGSLLPVMAEETPVAGIQESPYKVLTTIMDRGTAARTSQGYQAADLQLRKNIPAIDPTVTYDDLALFVNVYFENRDNPGDFTIFEDSGGQFQFVSTIETDPDTGKTTYYQTCWNWSKSNVFQVKEGWNTLLLNFSTTPQEDGITASNCNVDLSNIRNFRLAFWNFQDFDNYDKYRIRIADACIVDKRYKAEKEPVYDNTDPIVGTFPTLTEDTVYATQGGPGHILGSGDHAPAGGSIDLTGHNPEKLFLELEIFYQNKTRPDYVSDTFVSGQIRFKSEGSSAYAYFGSRSHYPNLKQNEWNLIRIPWKDLQNPGNIDPTKINNFYMYFDSVNHADVAEDTLEMKIRNVKIIDTTTEPKDMELPTLFGDGMIFQQKKPIKVWGSSAAGNTVTATMVKDGEGNVPVEITATADEKGDWEVEFPALDGSYDTYTITVTDATAEGKVLTTREFTDVVVGEVWVAGGQSNMALRVADDCQKTEILAKATNHHIRIYMEPTSPVGNGVKQPLDPLFSVPNARWGFGDVANDVVNTSSVGFNFICELQEKLDMPVGLLNTAFGGSVIEAWISRQTVDADPVYKKFLDDQEKYCDANWWPSTDNRQSTLFNAKIGPLEGYAAAGTIWYQGESNHNDIDVYNLALELLQKDWGRVFGFAEDEKMPLVYAHIAPYYYTEKVIWSSPATVLGWTAETFGKAWQTNPASMSQIAIYDLPLHHLKEDGQNSAAVIHPTTKMPVAARMLTAAWNLVYGGEGATSSPVYKSMEIKESAVYLTFDQVGDGLKIGNDSQNLQGFAIAGANGVYANAKAEIVGKDTVKVWHEKLAEPQNVTYAFTSFNMVGNLHNSDGLAAVPFRTSDDTYNEYLFKDHDWIYADGEVWVSVTASAEKDKAAFYDLWTATNATHTYDKEVKTEGLASLKVEYTGSSVIAVDPTQYPSMKEQQYQNFSGFTVDMKNPDSREKTVKVTLTTAGAPLVAGEITLPAGSDFASYEVSFAGLTADQLATAKGLAFEVTDEAAGTVYLDNIRFTANAALAPVAPPKADKAALQAAVDAALQVNTGAYTAETVAPFVEALTIAKAMANNIISTQTDVDKALKTLTAARAALVEKEITIAYGDVDKSGKVDVSDALLVLQYVTGKWTFSDEELVIADVDGVAEVNVSDALAILQKVTGKIEQFPVEVA